MTGFLVRVGRRFWVVPLAFAAAAGLLAVGLGWLDASLDTDVRLPGLFSGGPEGARSLLSAVIGSMITFTALVFSITIVVLQLTSSQFSPRVLRTFLRDRFNQSALGVFVATFVYALVVLREVRGTAQTDPYVPQVSVSVAFAFVMASVTVFLAYLHHIAQSIRAATIIDSIGRETRRVLERRYPPEPTGAQAPLPTGPASRIRSRRAGVVQQVEDGRLATAAESDGSTIVLLRAVGEFVPAGGALMEVHGGADVDESLLRGTVLFGRERSLDQDLGFGIRQLVDIAERALSPGVNDPSTAVQAVDQLHDLLRRLATRPLLPRQRVADDGRLLVHVPEPDFAAHLALAVEEIAHYAADAPRVRRRLSVMVADLTDAARPEHLPAVTRAAAAVDAAPDATPVGPVALPPASDVGFR